MSGRHARKRRPSRLVAAAVGVALVASAQFVGFVAVPAFAYFTAGGVGSGTLSTGTLQPLTILAASATPSSNLLPGATADLVVQVSNPNSVAVTITSITQGGGVTVVGGTGCTSDPTWPGTLGNSGVSVVSSTGLSIPVPASSSITVHLPAGAAMSTASVSGCQGAAFRIPVTVTVQQ